MSLLSRDPLLEPLSRLDLDRVTMQNAAGGPRRVLGPTANPVNGHFWDKAMPPGIRPATQNSSRRALPDPAAAVRPHSRLLD